MEEPGNKDTRQGCALCKVTLGHSGGKFVCFVFFWGDWKTPLLSLSLSLSGVPPLLTCLSSDQIGTQVLRCCKQDAGSFNPSCLWKRRAFFPFQRSGFNSAFLHPVSIHFKHLHPEPLMRLALY